MTSETCLRSKMPWLANRKPIDLLRDMRQRTTNRRERHALHLAIVYMEAEHQAFRERIDNWIKHFGEENAKDETQD